MQDTAATRLPATEAGSRPDRATLLAFLTDPESDEIIRDTLTGAVAGDLHIRRGGIHTAVTAMQKLPTPKVLIIDVTGEDHPLTALRELAQVLEPDVCVLVVGEVDSAEFYREITRVLGAAEYLPKPLTRDKVARQFGPLVRGQSAVQEAMLGGRLVAITGARGGVGATTIAVNLAWHVSQTMKRHTVLLDPDLHRGAAGLLLNVPPGAGLRQALEAPERIDVLLAERAAQPVADRLHVLSAEEKLDQQPDYAPGAAEALLNALRSRYNIIVADVPFAPIALNRSLLHLVHQRVIVLSPTLASVRDAMRLLALPAGPAQAQRPVLVLNRTGLPGGLPRKQVEEALKTKVDVAIPDLPRHVGNAATMGEAAVVGRGAFRSAVIELARQTGTHAVLDAGPGAAANAPNRTGRRWLSFRR